MANPGRFAFACLLGVRRQHRSCLGNGPFLCLSLGARSLLLRRHSAQLAGLPFSFLGAMSALAVAAFTCAAWPASCFWAALAPSALLTAPAAVFRKGGYVAPRGATAPGPACSSPALWPVAPRKRVSTQAPKKRNAFYASPRASAYQREL